MKKMVLASLVLGILTTILVAQVDHVLAVVFGVHRHLDINGPTLREGVLMGSQGRVSEGVQFTPAQKAIEPTAKELLNMARDAIYEKGSGEHWTFYAPYPSINAEFSGFPLRSFYWIKRPDAAREGGIDVHLGQFPIVIGTKILWSGLLINVTLYSSLVFGTTVWIRMRRDKRNAKHASI